MIEHTFNRISPTFQLSSDFLKFAPNPYPPFKYPDVLPTDDCYQEYFTSWVIKLV